MDEFTWSPEDDCYPTVGTLLKLLALPVGEAAEEGSASDPGVCHGASSEERPPPKKAAFDPFAATETT